MRRQHRGWAVVLVLTAVVSTNRMLSAQTPAPLKAYVQKTLQEFYSCRLKATLDLMSKGSMEATRACITQAKETLEPFYAAARDALTAHASALPMLKDMQAAWLAGLDAPLPPTETFYAWFEFDRINLASMFHTAMQEQGLQVAPAQTDATLLLTGAYSVTYDLVHYRFDWLQMKLVKQQTGQTLATFQMGQGGLESAETGVQKVVEEIRKLF